MSEQNPLQIGHSRIGYLNYGSPVGPEIWDFTKAYKKGVPVAGKITNFTQTVGTEHETIVGFNNEHPLYGGFTWRDIPKAIGYNQFFRNEPYINFPEGIHASFQLALNSEETAWDLITTVIEASNGHKYWLDQTVTTTLFYTDETGEHSQDYTYTFTEDDWATSPAYDTILQTGYIANPLGPSTFVRKQYDWAEFDGYLRDFSISNSTTIAEPQSPFQPPGG